MEGYDIHNFKRSHLFHLKSWILILFLTLRIRYSTDLIAAPTEDVDIYREPEKRIIKPDDQLDLSPDELKAEVTRVLTGDDPNAPKSISTFSYKERCYKLEPPGLSDNMAVHFVEEGCSLHIDSKAYEAHNKLYRQEGTDDDPNLKDGSLPTITQSTGTGTMIEKGKNRFNFSDRATQTFSNKKRSIFVCTEPPLFQQGIDGPVYR